MALGLVGLAVALSPLVASSGPARAAESAGTFDPQATYLRDCAICHGAEGAGTTRAPAIAGRGTADVDYELSTGRMPLGPLAPSAHPPRKAPAYTPDKISQLVAYVAGLGPPSGPPVPTVDVSGADLAHGGELYRAQCAACHSWDGGGGALLYREAPSLHAATPVQVAEAIRVGPNTMPSFGSDAFTDQEVNDIVAYVQYLKHPRDRGGLALWHLGPLAEGLIGWVIGIGVLVVALLWIGERESRARPPQPDEAQP